MAVPDVSVEVLPFDPVPVTLEARDVVLEPLELRHAASLADAGAAESVWRYLLGRAFESTDDARAWIEGARAEQATGSRLPFAIVDRARAAVVGSTSYLEINRPHRTIEIGWTWLALPVQRTGVNTQCKLSLLSHAFEHLGANRVQLKTDLRNERSQRAIERIGAVREGVLRQTMIMLDGHLRDTVYYSVLAGEWPSVKARLERLSCP